MPEIEVVHMEHLVLLGDGIPLVVAQVLVEMEKVVLLPPMVILLVVLVVLENK